MELWIRSQDKRTLRRVLSLDINGLEIMTSNVLLGEYKTKERALEVLDEIQKRMVQNEVLKAMTPKLIDIRVHEEKLGECFKKMVYEMPEE